MTDLQLLFLILALLYLWECSCWVRRGSVGFRSWLGRRWSMVHPGALLGNQSGALVFAAPLPPLGTFFTSSQFPFSLSSEGVLAFVASSVNPGWRPAQRGEFVRFAELREVKAAGKKVQVNGRTFLNAGSEIRAQALAHQLQELCQKTERNRESALAKLLERTLDTKAIEERLRQFRIRTRALRFVTNILFLYLFILVPLLIRQFGLSSSWAGLLGGLLACTTAIAILFRRAHHHFYPEAEDDRFTHFLIVLLSPATALRAHDLLSRPLLEGFHPLVVAKILCPARQFREYACEVVRELRHPALPLCPRPEPAAQATERRWRAALLEAMEKFLKGSEIDPESLLEAPQPNDPSCQAYCPRCGAQFTNAASACDDCGGLALVSFERALAAHR